MDFHFGFLGEGEGFDFWRERGFLRRERNGRICCPWFWLEFRFLYYRVLEKKNKSKFFFKIILTWKIVGVLEVSVIYIYISISIFITKSWSVAFNVAALRLSHISCHVIIILFPEFVLQFKISFPKFKNTNKRKIIPNPLCSTITILDGNPLCSTVSISNNNPLCSMVTILNGNPSAS